MNSDHYPLRIYTEDGELIGEVIGAPVELIRSDDEPDPELWDALKSLQDGASFTFPLAAELPGPEIPEELLHRLPDETMRAWLQRIVNWARENGINPNDIWIQPHPEDVPCKYYRYCSRGDCVLFYKDHCDGYEPDPDYDMPYFRLEMEDSND